MRVLVTGGAGFIGSHTVLELIKFGYKVVVLDNLCTSKMDVINRLSLLAGQEIDFVHGDIRDGFVLDDLFRSKSIDAVVHFAGLKSVGESLEFPLRYFDNNVVGTVNLLKVMAKFDCKKIVFSSSATVYGEPTSVPITEDFPVSTINPYGSSKLMVEDILRDISDSDNDWSIALLRYFNPVGAHSSGFIGEDPRGIPNNLMPYIAQVAIGLRESVSVFGSDYPTHDGTGVRDYIHVVDLSKGHLKALDVLSSNRGVLTVNLGTGRGYSVLEVVAAFERASGKKVPYQLAERRPGDSAICYANPAFAMKVLGWKAEYDLDRMCQDTWRWQIQNPNGYTD